MTGGQGTDRRKRHFTFGCTNLNSSSQKEVKIACLIMRKKPERHLRIRESESSDLTQAIGKKPVIHCNSNNLQQVQRCLEYRSQSMNV